jgi:DNA invertase Pin-like site-specific DNA recombinase
MPANSDDTVGYCRISDDREGEEAGTTRQKEDIRTLADTRGLKLRDVLVDNDISATSGEYRPGFEEIMELVDAGEITTVIAWTSNRFLRSRRDRLRVIELFKARGARLIACRGPQLDYTTPDGRMVADMLGAIDTGEAERISDRTSRAARQRAEQGKSHGGNRAFGYGLIVPDQFRPDGRPYRDPYRIVPEEAEQIRIIAQEIIDGHSLGSIVTRLNGSGVLPVGGKTWTRPTVQKMMLSPRLVGMRPYRYDDDTRGRALAAPPVMGPAQWPAILDHETWEQVRAVLADTTRRAATKETGKRPSRHLLAGFAYCAGCGRKMVGRPEKYDTVYCLTRPGLRCQARANIKESWLIALVELAIRDRLDSLALAVPEQSDPTESELAALEARKQAATDRWARGELSDDRLDLMLSAIERQTTDLRVQARRHARRSASLPVDGAAGWDGANFAKRRSILTALADAVIITRASGRGEAESPSRVRIVWRDEAGQR